MKLIQLKEAAERLGVSRQTIINWGKAGVVKIIVKNKSYWMDADTINALADTAEDFKKAQEEVRKMTDELLAKQKELKQRIMEVRYDIMFANTVAEECIVREFYIGIPKMLYEIGRLNKREMEIVKGIINGESFASLGDKYHLTSSRIREVFHKAIRRSHCLSSLKDEVDQARREHGELLYLRKMAAHYAEKIKDLEKQLGFKTGEIYEDDKINMALLKDFNLSTRALSCLHSADINTVGELLLTKKNDVLRCRNFGKKTLIELEEFMESIGKKWE